MALVKQTGYIVHEQYSWQDEGSFQFRHYQPSAEISPESLVVGEHEITFEVPDDFDARPGKVKNLEAQKAALRLELAEKLMQIDQQISNLLCIENKVSEQVA